MKPYLALFRGGPASLHPHAVQRLEAQNFDYARSMGAANVVDHTADPVAAIKASKSAAYSGQSACSRKRRVKTPTWRSKSRNS